MKRFYLILAAIAALAMTAQATVPANPTADNWYDCGDESGFSKFYFTLPTTDIDGNYLDRENLSYVIWINDGNGEVYQFTFPAEDYTFDLYYDIDEVPYDLYISAVDFHDYYVYMYRTNQPGYNPLFVRDEGHDGNIGIQVFYTDGGTRTPSEIAWLYELTPPEPPTPTDPTAAPSISADIQLGIHAYFVTITESEPSDLYYHYQKDSGDWTDWTLYTDPIVFEEDGDYLVEAYAIAPGKIESQHVTCSFVVSPRTGLDEFYGDKAVSSVRYFNVAGQEMQEANGMTIVVTIYTDGTTSAVKVMK
jgi:hypothetical protein